MIGEVKVLEVGPEIDGIYSVTIFAGDQDTVTSIAAYKAATGAVKAAGAAVSGSPMVFPVDKDKNNLYDRGNPGDASGIAGYCATYNVGVGLGF